MSWLDLTEVKNHLNLPTGSTSNDAEVQLFIDAAELAIRRRIGWVAPPSVALVEWHYGGRGSLRLDERPLATVEAIISDGVAVLAADRDTGVDGWYLDKTSRGAGLVRHTDRFPSAWVKVTYKPGLESVPADVVKAGKELVRHLWSTQRGNVPRRPDLTSNPDNRQSVVRHYAGFALPNRVVELLQPLIPIGVA